MILKLLFYLKSDDLVFSVGWTASTGDQSSHLIYQTIFYIHNYCHHYFPSLMYIFYPWKNVPSILFNHEVASLLLFYYERRVSKKSSWRRGKSAWSLDQRVCQVYALHGLLIFLLIASNLVSNYARIVILMMCWRHQMSKQQFQIRFRLDWRRTFCLDRK